MNLKRMVIEFEVLYDADIDDLSDIGDLEEIHHQTMVGHASGSWKLITNESVSKEKMKELLIAQGTDPEFLLSDDLLSDD